MSKKITKKEIEYWFDFWRRGGDTTDPRGQQIVDRIHDEYDDPSLTKAEIVRAVYEFFKEEKEGV